MRPHHLSLCARSVTIAFLGLLCVARFSPLVARAPQAEPSQPGTVGKRIWLRDAQQIAVNHVGSAKAMQAISSAQPLALAEGDFDADGVEDVVVGYASANGGILAVHRGNLDAFAPQSEESFQAIGRGEFPSPFLPTAVLVDVPVRPDFVAVGSFNGEGYPDVILAQRGDRSIYLLGNNGKGIFSAPKQINVGGPITSLASGDLGPHGIYGKLLVGISDHTGSHLMVYTGTLNGLGGVKVLSLPGPASNINFGDLGDIGPDAIFVAGGQVMILHSSSMRLETLSLGATAQSIALGSFIWDRNPQLQIAILDSNGGLHLAAHNEFDPRAFTTVELESLRLVARGRSANPLARLRTVPQNGWKIAETVSGIAPSAGPTPILLKTRISDHGADDVMVLNAFTGQMTLISHPDLPAGATSFVPAEISYRPYNGSPTAAIAMRTNVDGRPGIVAIHQGQIAPSVMMPLPDPTFFPNEFDDPAVPTSGGTPNTAAFCNNTSNTDTSSPCSLREAIVKANLTAGTDTVQLAAGTYTLTIAKVTGDYSGQFGALYVNDSLNIVGAGQNSTIIQAGTTNATGVDMVMAVNEDINPITNATASISNLTLQNGHNNGTHGNDGDGGCMEFDTGSSGTATLSLTNVTLNSCSTTQGNGAGIAIFNFTNPGAGAVTISNSIIQNNAANDSVTAGEAGGIWASQSSHLTMSTSQVLNNTANNTSSTGGGGIATTNHNVPPSALVTIHSSTISGNHSAGDGGGINNETNLLIDQGSVISDNTSTSSSSGGGGLYSNVKAGDAATLTKVTITGNSASGGAGGGIYNGNASGGVGGLTMSFSRLAGNSASTAGTTNLNNNDSTVIATNNWWGTNAPASTITTTGSSGSTTFDPFIVLTHTASPSKIRINQSSTLTADMSMDNHGDGAALSSNLDEIVDLPITFDGAVLGTISQAQPETLGNPVPNATATFNAGGTAGLGTANATVDQAVVPVNSNLISSATESGTTATITTVGATGFSTGQLVQITGVGVSGYNSTSSEFFTVASTPTANTFTYTADTSGLADSSGGTVNGGIIILQPPSIAKSFSLTTSSESTSLTTTVAENTPVTVNFVLTNSNVVTIDASFTDGLPSGLVVATSPSVVNGCGGTVTATTASGSISFSNASLAVGTCTISVNVQSAVDGTYNNSVTIDSSDAGNGNTSSATLIVINPPSITKSFGATSVPLSGTTSLSFGINNPNTNSTLNGISFTDSLPAGLVVATPNGASLPTTCGSSAAIMAAAGSSSVTFSGASLAPGASCTPSVNVTGTTAGLKNNSVQVSSTNGGTGNTSNASVTVVGPPVLSKVFGATSIPLNGSTSLSFNVQNNNSATTLDGISFSDTLPAGLVISTPNGLAGSCGGGTITATQGTGALSLSGASLAATGSCTFSVNVTGTAAGQQNNTTSAITSTEGGTGGTASASVNVVAPPSIAKVFVPVTIPVSGTSSLTLTITNPAGNTVAETGVAFSDTLPTGLTVGSATSTACSTGTLTTNATNNSISLAGGTVNAGTPCQFSVTVTGATSGQYTNTTGNVSSTNGGAGNTASAGLTVASPPSITKLFGASSIPLNGATSLSFNIANPNTNLGLTGVSFTDNLPAGLVVASTPNLSNSCNGTATATTGATAVTLSAGTIASGGSCAVSVNVQGTSAGVKNNSVTVSSTEGGTGNTSNASITVVAPPTITKAFGALSTPLNGTTTLTFNLSNPNATGLSGVAFTDTLPSNLVVSTPNGLTGSCGGGAIAASGSGISLSGGALAANGTCTFSVNVNGVAAGTANNTTSAVTSHEGGTGTTASASIAVVAPPVIAKGFTPSQITVGATTSLGFTITNPSANTVAEQGVAFTDVLPAGLTVTNGTGTACGGTLTTSGGNTISLSGATIGGSCPLNVTVTGTTPGSFTNVTGDVSSSNGGTGNSATAGLTVAQPPSMTKSFGASTIPLNGTSSMTFNITNPNTGSFTISGVQFTDTLPSGLVVSSPTATNSCGGTATVGSGGFSFSLTGGSIAAGGSCSVSTTVRGTTAGVKNNSTTVSSTNAGTGNTPTATITVVAPPAISKAFGAASIPLNASTSLSFQISNPNTVELTGINLNDLLPSQITFSPSTLSGSCGVAPTVTTSSLSLSGGSVAAGATCNFSVNVNGAAAGTANNTTSAVSSANGGTGGTASASLFVVTPPVISKAFTPSVTSINGTSSLGFTITNPSANTVSETGVAFTDVLPNGLTVANGTTPACGGTLTTTGNKAISLSGATIGVGGTCTPSVTVTATIPGILTNTTGNVSSTNGGTGNTAMASLQVGDFNISLSPTNETIPPGHMASFTVTVSSSSGFQGEIDLSGTGSTLPPGSTLTISPPKVTLLSSSETAKVTVTLAVPNRSASKGTWQLKITGSSKMTPAIVHTTTATLKVGLND